MKMIESLDGLIKMLVINGKAGGEIAEVRRRGKTMDKIGRKKIQFRSVNEIIRKRGGEEEG